MRKLAFLSVAFALVAVSFYGCDETTSPENLSTPESVTPAVQAVSGPLFTQNGQPLASNGASVLNNGAKDVPDFWCRGQGFITHDVTVVLRPNGGSLLSCQWDGLPEIETTVVRRDFECFLSYQGLRITNRTRQTRTRSGQQSMTCVFD